MNFLPVTTHQADFYKFTYAHFNLDLINTNEPCASLLKIFAENNPCAKISDCTNLKALGIRLPATVKLTVVAIH